MRCGEADRLMSRQLEGALSPRDEARLSQHLATCARCRALDVALRRAVGLVERPAWPAAVPDVTARVLSRLPSDRRAVVPPAPAWTRASALVTAALVVLCAGLVGAALLGGALLESAPLSLVGQGGRDVALAGWDGLLHVQRALGVVGGALWQALRWPWLAVVGAGVAVAGAVWVWLWQHSLRGA